MGKKAWVIVVMVLNILVIGMVVWLTWVQPKKPIPVIISEVKVKSLKLEQPRNAQDFSKIIIAEREKREQRRKEAKKKPEKKIIKVVKERKKKRPVSKKPLKVNTYGLLSDTYTNPSLKFDIANPGNVDGGYLGAWGAAMVKGGIPDTYTDPPTSLKVSCPGGWGGIWLQFGFNPETPPGEAVEKDMSLYGKYIKFDIKTNEEVIFGVEWWDNIAGNKDSAERKFKQDLNFPTDNTWHSVRIDLRDLVGKNYQHPINFKKIKLPASFCGKNVTFSIDNLRWEK